MPRRGGKGKSRGGARSARGGGRGGHAPARPAFGSPTSGGAADEIGPVLPLDCKYSAAGILPYRVQNGQVEVMLAVEHRKDKADGPSAKKKNFLTVLGGPPRTDAQLTDQNYIVTAVRQLHVKTGEALPTASVNGIMELCAKNQGDKLASFFWAKGKYVLVVYPWAHDERFVEQFNGTRGQNRPHQVALSLQWVPVQALYAAAASNSISLGNQTVKIYSLLRSLLREAPTLMNYMAELQRQLTGSAPATGGAAPFGGGGGGGGGGGLFGGAASSSFGSPGAAGSTGGGLFGGVGGASSSSSSTASTSSGGMFGSPIANAPTPAAGDFKAVAEQFGATYYQAFNTNKAALQQVLTAETRFSCVGDEIVGAQPILAKLQTLQMQLNPTKMDCQPMPGPNNSAGVLMVVVGNISNTDKRFSQVFTLAPVPGAANHVILNTLLRDQ